MKGRLVRPTAVLFPLVCGVGAWLGSEPFIAHYFALQLFSLCAADSFRNAATREPGVRRVDRRFSGAFVPLLFAVGLALLLVKLGLGFESAAVAMAPLWVAAPVAIEHLFEERMFALGRKLDGAMLSGVANALLLTGMLLDWAAGGGLRYLTGGAALGAAVSVLTNYAIERPHGFSLVPRNLGDAPLACVQTLLYPVALGLADALLGKWRLWEDLAGAPGLAPFYGLMLWRLARTPHRRTADESRGMNLLLLALTGAGVAAGAWMEALAPLGLAGLLGLICAGAVFCAWTPRFAAGVVLLLAAGLPWPGAGVALPVWEGWLRLALALAAPALNAKGAFLRKR